LSKWGINPKRLRYITGLDTEYVGSHKIYIVSGFITLRDLKGGLLGSCDNTSRHLRGHSVDIKIFHDPIKQSITNGHFDSRANVFVEGKPNMFGRIDMPKKIINSGPATVCIWKEKEKTVSMCMPGETKDPLYGFLMCFFKRYCGMKPRQMKKWLNKKVGSNFKGV